MQLEMKGWDIDTYIATFNQLVARVGWSTSDKGIMEKFRNGLARWLALDIMHKYKNIPATLDEWKTAAKKEILQRAQIKAKMPSQSNTGMPYCYDLFPFLLIYFLFCLSLCTVPCLALFAFLCACFIAYLCVVLGHILHDT